MAEAMSSMSCSICLDLLKDPVTIPCGHSYCMGCIKDCFDQEDDKGIYSCPQCRQTFTPRPVLNRNTMFSELLEKRKTKKKKKTKLQSPPGHYSAGPGDVECDFCTGRKLKAIKFCLVCLASYCETHLQPHYEVPAFKKHTLVQASTQLQEKICSHHDNLLEVYCRTDQQCICYLCTMDEHKGHDTVSAAAERTEKMKQLGEKHQKCQKRIQERQKEIQKLRKSVDSVKHSAQAAVEDSERIFTELICFIEKRRSELKELIRDQEEAEEMDRISHKVTTVQIGPPAEPKTREDFLSSSCQLTLDPTTENENLCLSEGNRKPREMKGSTAMLETSAARCGPLAQKLQAVCTLIVPLSKNHRRCYMTTAGEVAPHFASFVA
ncbi:hypothetical protein DPEC_G00356220 [Dallia pectoralis]|uniref:Uncharacterized protein n=1 Tax=Dallia pectoralis TaxID=75939 RepID=A0ACC2EZN7_DALPE|nr:hypothetical protein DPEC_G00356220 [Dallia pectoralis]